MTFFARLLIATCALAASSLALANDPPSAPAKADAAKGGALYGAVCTSCHGADGNSGAPIYPKLAQQHPEYIAKQLVEYKSGKRANAIMSGLSASLSEDDARNIGAFLATKTSKPGFAKDKDLATLGEKIYRGGIADFSIVC